VWSSAREPVEFVGRDDEVSRVEEALDAIETSPQALLSVGPPGIGKTATFIRRFAAARARRSPFSTNTRKRERSRGSSSRTTRLFPTRSGVRIRPSPPTRSRRADCPSLLRRRQMGHAHTTRLVHRAERDRSRRGVRRSIRRHEIAPTRLTNNARRSGSAASGRWNFSGQSDKYL
jgi:DNA polymerase III delta prime subunit